MITAMITYDEQAEPCYMIVLTKQDKLTEQTDISHVIAAEQ